MTIKRLLKSGSVVASACLVVVACTQMDVQPSTTDSAAPTTALNYNVALKAGEDSARASIRLGRGARRVSELRFRIDPDRQANFRGDGDVSTKGNEVVWNPPRKGGALNYDVVITHKRRNGAYDARVTDDWALFRADRVFPPATTTRAWRC